MEYFTISKLAEFATVGVETVRFYQRKGLLRQPNAKNGIRKYGQQDVSRIIFIKKAQELGFSLAEVKELLELNSKPRATCSTVRAKAEKKIAEIEEKIRNLQNMKIALSDLACACDAGLDQVRQYEVQECFNISTNCCPK